MNSRKNFSLLEISIASVVFAIAILSMLAVLSVNFRLQTSNKETMVAINAANEKLNLFLTDPLLFRKLNRSNLDGPELTPVNLGDLTNPYNWSRNITDQIWTAEFQVAGVNVQQGLTYAGSVSVNCYSIDPDPTIPSGTPLPLPGGIDYFEVIVVVRWNGVSGDRRIVMQGQRYRLKEDSDIQVAPSIP